MSSSQEVVTYLTSLCILGYMLPLAITICSTLVLILRSVMMLLKDDIEPDTRRCVNCGRCCSSHCREELSLVLVSTVFTLSQFAMYLPILDFYLAKYVTTFSTYTTYKPASVMCDINTTCFSSFSIPIYLSPPLQPTDERVLMFRFELPTSEEEVGEYLTPELSRGVETLSGLAFPLIIYMTLPGENNFTLTPWNIHSSLQNVLNGSRRNGPDIRGGHRGGQRAAALRD